MELPRLEDSVLLIAKLLKVSREQADELVNLNRLHLALVTPTTHVAGAPVDRTVAQVAARVFAGCAQGVVPHQHLRFAWLMAVRAIELNGYRWPQQVGDGEQLRRHVQELRNGRDGGRALARWIEERIVPQRPGSDDSPRQLKILVISPMTGVKGARCATLRSAAAAVDDGVVQFIAQEHVTDDIITIRPQILPPYVTEDELNDDADQRVLEADGVVVLASRGSWGASFELEMSLRRGIPVLYLHPEELELSPRVAGRLRDAQATCRRFELHAESSQANEQIAALVKGWLESEYAAIRDTERRRDMLQSRLAKFLAALQAAWSQFGEFERRKRLAAVGLTERRASSLLKEDQLPSASVRELMMLAVALDVAANLDVVIVEAPSHRPKQLTEDEIASFEDVIRVDRIPPREVIEMTRAAEREVAAPGRRRKTFTDDESWRDLRRRLFGRP